MARFNQQKRGHKIIDTNHMSTLDFLSYFNAVINFSFGTLKFKYQNNLRMEDKLKSDLLKLEIF
ncbi:hypothetical protein BpHYR1_030585 [Brachionus plicatilis]|uniref:Uncharacterized protein n=1 Tax=Brachionus plicatilis TaxID=10195 RepID=A0A3M7P8Y2_BRAPC|nr:hypothetical protein BpHYR1_030585 [Brachionus plicatilis]